MLRVKDLPFIAVTAAFAVACGSDRSNGGTGGNGTGTATGGTGTGASGTVNAGGNGTGGTTAVDICAGKDVTATGTDGLLDDLEDSDTAVRAADGRVGSWYVSGDPGCTLMPPEGPPPPEAPVAGANVANASNYSVHVAATGCNEYGFGLSASFNLQGAGACAYDAAAYDGMYFWGVGEAVELWVAVGTRQTTPISQGGDGTCADGACWNSFGTSITLTGDWARYDFTWDELMQQAGWGTPTDWDVTQTTTITWSVTHLQVGETGASYSIDNVGFFKGTPPSDPPMPGAGGLGGGGGSGGAGGGG